MSQTIRRIGIGFVTSGPHLHSWRSVNNTPKKKKNDTWDHMGPSQMQHIGLQGQTMEFHKAMHCDANSNPVTCYQIMMRWLNNLPTTKKLKKLVISRHNNHWIA